MSTWYLRLKIVTMDTPLLFPSLASLISTPEDRNDGYTTSVSKLSIPSMTLYSLIGLLSNTDFLTELLLEELLKQKKRL